MKDLSPYQRQQVLIAYFLYSVFYKWGAGISKMATCFLLLAISAPHMVAFNRFCLGMIAYILGYSISCSIATVFQCGSDPRANWDPSLDRKDCFYKPPFWFAHGGLNIVAIIATGTLPWWLFMKVTVRRRHWIATLMTILVIGELVPSVYRLYGLYLSSQHLDDISYITTTGIFVSQLEVEFGVTAACVPTMLKILEEGWDFFSLKVLGRRRDSGPEIVAGDSRENMINRDESGEIRVEKTYAVSSSSGTGAEEFGG
ncbi:hypothetical protein QBC33DRAFT_573883 [Phialemonium atrogriseum]|uniref:Rhodopsin domain-containing protein n=1 Tax=Phialemonium atrogriseum TaxID=1093897 RepID=A0AAJ0BTJ1_9PEZI|nr:uncharacterized protein QBC33DRAFT_573883 [Phialemonium atrogriseum]KAK1762787.1 hypothetical protein QBC33DRAFT_573883 [Phialemonium atrogriseum]